MPIAEWIHVSKRYRKDGPLALDDVSFHVGAGEIVVIVGPNGSGKTSAMEMLSGLRVPTTGTVRLIGEVVRPGGHHRQSLGVQLQEAGLPLRIRVREAIAAVACLYRDPGPVGGEELDHVRPPVGGVLLRRLMAAGGGGADRLSGLRDVVVAHAKLLLLGPWARGDGWFAVTLPQPSP